MSHFWPFFEPFIKKSILPRFDRMTLLDYVEIDPLSTIGNGITLVDLAPVSLSVRPSFILSYFHSVSVSEPSQFVSHKASRRHYGGRDGG